MTCPSFTYLFAQGERQKRVAAQKKKAELAQQLDVMTQQLELLTQDGEGAGVLSHQGLSPKVRLSLETNWVAL